MGRCLALLLLILSSTRAVTQSFANDITIQPMDGKLSYFHDGHQIMTSSELLQVLVQPDLREVKALAARYKRNEAMSGILFGIAIGASAIQLVPAYSDPESFYSSNPTATAWRAGFAITIFTSTIAAVALYNSSWRNLLRAIEEYNNSF